MTKEERHLWYDFLKKLPLTINKQKPVGNYILDFYISEKRIAIEIDGRQHQTRDSIASDKERDAFLHNQGIKVLRYSNQQINRSFKIVCDDILSHLGILASEMLANR